MKKLYSTEEIEIGMNALYILKTITDANVKQFSRLSADNNPVRVDEIYAENSRYKKRISNGLVSASFFETVCTVKNKKVIDGSAELYIP